MVAAQNNDGFPLGYMHDMLLYTKIDLVYRFSCIPKSIYKFISRVLFHANLNTISAAIKKGHLLAA